MLEYLLGVLLIILSILYITRSAWKKTVKSAPNEDKSVRKSDPVLFVAPCPDPYPDWSIETTRPLPYRPFKYGPDFFVTMGIGRLDWNDWIELDNEWIRYHNEKLSRLFDEHAFLSCRTAPEAYDAALETMELLSEYLVHRYPSLFEYQFDHNDKNKKQIRIKATNEIYPIRSEDPLKYASLLIEDDLALMIEGSDEQYYLKAGSIVLPGFWRLEDKFNMSLAQIHLSGKVPQYKEKLEQSMERFFQKMTPENPVVRHNYGIQTDNNLAWASSIGPEETYGVVSHTDERTLTIEDLYFRCERQTLRRLPRSRAILFTIRPYFHPIREIVQETGVPGRLASAIRSWPDDVAQHRGKSRYADILLKYLDEKHQQQLDQAQFS